MPRSTAGSSRAKRIVRSLVVLALGVLIVGTPTLLTPSVAQAEEVTAATPGGAFEPKIPQVFVAQGWPTTLFAGQQTPGHLDLQSQGSTPKVSYNAVGFNAVDNFMYGIKASEAGTYGTNRLVKIGQNGVATDLGPVAGLPLPGYSGNAKVGNSYTQGAFGGTPATAQTLYVRDYNYAPNNLTMWSIDVTSSPLSATKIAIEGLPSGITGLADFTAGEHSFWGVSDTVIYEIYISGPGQAMMTDYPINIPQMKNRHFGAAWTYGNGNYGFQDNPTGDIFHVRQVSVNGTTGFELIAEFKGPSSSNNDGTNIVGEPVDLGVVKQGPANYTPGGAMNYTMTVTNYGPGMSSGSVITDVPPPGLTNPTTSTPGCEIIAGELKCVLGALAVGASTEVQMGATVVAEVPGALKVVTNRVDVLGNEFDPRLENNWDSTAARPLPGILELEKASNPASGTQVNPGQLVDYTLTFRNTGGAPIAVSHQDAFSDVLDDADREGAITLQAPLSVVESPTGLAITGSLAPGATATVKYSARVKTTFPATASGKLGNFLFAQGTELPATCIAESKLCTEHPVRVSLAWNKVNDRTPAAFLAGSEWTLTPYDRATTPALVPANKIDVVDCVAALDTDCAGPDKNRAEGKFKIAGLTIGKYQLAETKAPAGYLRITPIDIEVYSDVDHGNIVNRQVPVPVLPLTGGMGTAVFWGGAAGLGLLATTALILQRRRMRLGQEVRSGA